jgi:hypothetical protein
MQSTEPHSIFDTKYSKSILAFLALSSFAPAQNNVTLNCASGNETFNVALSNTGGLTLGLGFEVEYLLIGGGGSGSAGTAFVGGNGGSGISVIRYKATFREWLLKM